ncbi:hypothetical protein Tco_1211375 [Tanacetum coccineum]
MASQDARLSKFEADFKQQQSEMTNKINTVLKAITDRISGTLPRDTVKNPILSTSLVFSARSYPTEDPQCSTLVYGSINVVTIHPKQQSHSHDDRTKENEEEEKDSPENIHVNPSTPPDLSVSLVTKKSSNSIHSSNHSDMEKEHKKSVYLRNEEDKRRGVEYIMSKILGFYKECLELGPEYAIGIDDEGEITLYLTRRSLEDLRMFSLDDSWRTI